MQCSTTSKWAATMSTGTPTSSLPGATPPPGLPDAVTLARLASEIFNTPPGAETTASALLAQMPVSPQNWAGFAPRATALTPSSQQATGLPDVAGTGVPPVTGRASGPLLGVPEAYAAALPTVTGLSGADAANVSPAPPQIPAYYFLDDAASPPSSQQQAQRPPAADPDSNHDAGGGAAPAPAELGLVPSLQNVPEPNAPVPSSPYYFIGESSAYPGAASGAEALVAAAATNEIAAVPGDYLTAQPYALPGTDELQEALRSIDVGLMPDAPATTAREPRFYFLETVPPAAGGGAVPQAGQEANPPFDVHAVRRDFPILSERVNGRPLVWFDNAATTQKPRSVIDRLSYFYQHENSNIHRGAHELAARATDAYEAARSKIARFLGASDPEEIIFVRGTTEGINLVAQSWARQNIAKGDEIVLSHLEHHANIVPWQQIASEKGAKIRVIPVDDSGQVLLEEYRRLLSDHTKIVAVSQVSNALGTVVPVKPIIELAHRAGAKALVDGAQSVAHMRVDVRALDADFFVFSGHKIYGPTGIGAVYGKRELLEQMPPWQGGGNMISDVTFERTLYAEPPSRFEAGTGNIADAVGLGVALDYLERIGLENVGRYEHDLLEYGTQALRTVPGLRLIGTAKDKASVMSFVLEGHSVEEVGKALNQEGIAVRAGHHCAQPILRRFGVEATVRPSLAFYNTCEEIDRMIAVLLRLAGARRTGRSTV